MSSRSSTSSFRRSLWLGAVLLAGMHLAVHATLLPPLALWGGDNWARKEVLLRRLGSEETVEVLAVGSSHMDFGFDAQRFTELTGRSAFNLGLPGTDAYFQSLSLLHVLIPRHRPKVILWALGDSLRSRSAINHQYLQSPALRHAQMAGAWITQIEDWMLYHQRRKPLEWYRTAFEPLRRLSARGDPTLPEHSNADEELADREGSDRRADALPELVVSEEVARQTFEEALRFARVQGIEVFVLLTPFSEELYGTDYGQKPLRGGVGGFNAWLDEVLRRNEVPLVNLRYSEEISNNPALFYNANHLNRPGAEKLTTLLAPIVQGEPIPTRWRETPSAAERDFLLGSIDRDRLPVFPVGSRIPLEQADGRADRRGQEGFFAQVEVETEGTYRLHLIGSRRRARTGSYLVRIGGGGFRPMTIEKARGEPLILPVEFTLLPGVHEVEFRREAGDPVDCAAFGVFGGS